MSSETLEVKKRDGIGSIASRKLRQAGCIPAVLYGHGEQNVNLTVRSDAIGKVIQHGTKLLSLTGDVSDTALLRDVQWDPFGIDVLHIDLARVSQMEAVEITIPIEMHGEAPGTKEGGILSVVLHELTMLCPAASIPEAIIVNVTQLHMGDQLTAEQLKLPEGASLVTGKSEVVVHIVPPELSDEEAEGSEVEPELIRKEKAVEED